MGDTPTSTLRDYTIHRDTIYCLMYISSRTNGSVLVVSLSLRAVRTISFRGRISRTEFFRRSAWYFQIISPPRRGRPGIPPRTPSRTPRFRLRRSPRRKYHRTGYHHRPSSSPPAFDCRYRRRSLRCRLQFHPPSSSSFRRYYRTRPSNSWNSPIPIR